VDVSRGQNVDDAKSRENASWEIAPGGVAAENPDKG